MRLRVTRTRRSLSSTQARFLTGQPVPEVVEGTLVLFRPPAVDGTPRWSPTDLEFEAVLRLSRRLALLIGEGDQKQLWHTSVVDQPPEHQKQGGWIVRTETGSIYTVEVLREGVSVRPVRRATGSFPVYDCRED